MSDVVGAPLGAKKAPQAGDVSASVVPESDGVGPLKLFVVVGTCGEYSDRREWLVRAFCEEKTAQTFAETLKRNGMEIYDKRERMGRYSESSRALKHTALDPDYDDDYTGPPDYTVAPVPLGLPPTAMNQESPPPASSQAPEVTGA